MTHSLLLTQCLQNDFVKPIERYESIPNRLHVGRAEALRLMGEDATEGPVARVMRWAYGATDDQVRVVHIRDWHDPGDPAQAPHLERFGHHCLQHSDGAAFAFPAECDTGKDVAVIDSLTLNDFNQTALEATLAPLAGGPLRVGVCGVWTEAKVSFLAYELRTRYPEFQVAVCSALTASSSRARHFQALDQLDRILGVRVLDSVGAFVEFLGGDDDAVPLPVHDRHPAIVAEGFDPQGEDRLLLRYLFRDCRAVTLATLDGGFSGNIVASTASVDMEGHDQAPHVVKIGPRQPIGKERTAFERIQEVLGNTAPQISEFADFGDRGAIKYRYASMGGTGATTFQKAYQDGLPQPEVEAVLDAVFGEQLHRLYKAGRREACDLLDYYDFDPKWAASVRTKVEAVLGAPAAGPTIAVLPGLESPNICPFYEHTLAHLPRRPGDQCYHAFVHGDLNGANIILDGHRNVWLIDFFHTHRGHVLRDLVKLENDLLYIFTPVDGPEALRDACRFTDALMAVSDLGDPLPAAPESLGAPFQRAWTTVRHLRGFYPGLIHADRSPWQLWVAQLRYAVHTLGFDESNAWQKRWALYTASRCVARIEASLEGTGELRLDHLPAAATAPGRLALTLLPGRRDYGREITADLAVLTAAGVTHVVCLVPTPDLADYGVPDLLQRYAQAGLAVHHLPVLDQRACPVEAMQVAVAWMEAALASGGTVVAHCVGGLGRAGMAAACLLRGRGVPADEALATVRTARSERAIETAVQEALVRAYPAGGEG